MKLIKLTMISDKGFLKQNFQKRTIWVNPMNVDYVWDWTDNDSAITQTVLHINGHRIYVKENFRDVMKLLGTNITKGDEK
jgi:hypothetical protein